MTTTEQDLKHLTNELNVLLQDVAQDDAVPDAQLADVLQFIDKVVEVVDQAFRDVHKTLLRFKHLSDQDTQPPNLQKLRLQLDRLISRDRFRDAEQICIRLDALEQQYNSEIRPLVGHLPYSSLWRSMYQLLNEHEGRIIWLVHNSVDELNKLLDGPLDPAGLAQIRRVAGAKADAIYESLMELTKLRDQISGHSGRTGFIELLASGKRSRLKDILSLGGTINVTNERVINVGNNNVISAPLVIADKIENSFNALEKSPVNDDLKTLLAQLVTQVNDLYKVVPPDQSESVAEMARDAETLVKEATSPKPRKQWYELSLEGLKQAAQNIGEVAKPVLETALKLAPMLA